MDGQDANSFRRNDEIVLQFRVVRFRLALTWCVSLAMQYRSRRVLIERGTLMIMPESGDAR
jgi:hypothetical protein